MDPWVIALVAVSAVLHVAWNVRLKTAGDPLRAATVGMLAASVGIVPVGVAAWLVPGGRPLPDRGHRAGRRVGRRRGGYFMLLSAAYRRGDLSVVYPIARGTAPLLAVAIGVVVLRGAAGRGRDRSASSALLAGFLVLQRPWRAIARQRPARRRRGSRGGRRQRDPVRARDGRDDRDATARSTGSGRG